MQRNYDIMNNMKDDNGIVLPSKLDEKPKGVELDEDDYIIDDEEEELVIIDAGDMDDCAWTPDDYWFQQQGGLTADAYNFLYTLDSQGELV